MVTTATPTVESWDSPSSQLDGVVRLDTRWNLQPHTTSLRTLFIKISVVEMLTLSIMDFVRPGVFTSPPSTACVKVMVASE